MTDREEKMLNQLAGIGIALDMGGYHADAQCVRDALALLMEQDRHQAHWEDSPDPTWQHCTLCGVAVKKSAVKWVKASEDSNLNYCPHCGAEMKVSEDG